MKRVYRGVNAERQQTAFGSYLTRLLGRIHSLMLNSFADATVVASALSRQAIFDAKLDVWAYELRHATPRPESGDAELPRTSAFAEDAPRSGEQTGALILSAFVEFGLHRVVGDRKAFVSASARTLTAGLPLPLPRQRVTLQINDYIHGSERLLTALRDWKDQGFDIALDAFVPSRTTLPLLDVVDWVKIDVTGVDEGQLRSVMAELRRHFAEPIAVHVATGEQLRFCSSLGFTSFQGDFLLRPQLLQRAELPSSFATVSHVLAILRDPDVDFAAIEQAVKRDPSLTVAVLKFLNSGAYAFRREVASVSQAVSLLGTNEFTKWLLLVMLSARKNKPSELLTTALVRARTCENFARHRRDANPAQAFTVGVLSIMDALLDRTMEELLEELPLTPNVRSAILEFSGPEGQILEAVVSREHAPPHIPCEEQILLTRAWLEAVQWADVTRRGL